MNPSRPAIHERARRARATSARIALAGAVLVVVAHATACRVPLPEPAPSRLDEPNADEVERVVFLIGDAGQALPDKSPVIARLTRDVEAWAGGLGEDSAVTVIYLGDNVYPVGIRPVSDPEHAADTLHLRAQLDVVAGPHARENGSSAFFLAGNHDWGNLIGAAGLERLRNQKAKIDAARGAGLKVRFLPDPGEPGPSVVDLGTRVRLVFMDTHWWLQARTPQLKAAVLTGVEDAIRSAGGRDVLIAAHHPFVSGGAHGGPVSIWEGLGIIWLLRQTGSLVQDLNSAVYKELLGGLRDVFERAGRPLLFAGGHDHSLQVIEDGADNEPVWSLVSGAGSKITEVAHVSGTLWAEDVAGFMRLAFMRDGSVLLHVLATPGQYATCDPLTEDVPTCMTEGLQAFETLYAIKLK